MLLILLYIFRGGPFTKLFNYALEVVVNISVLKSN